LFFFYRKYTDECGCASGMEYPDLTTAHLPVLGLIISHQRTHS